MVLRAVGKDVRDPGPRWHLGTGTEGQAVVVCQSSGATALPAPGSSAHRAARALSLSGEPGPCDAAASHLLILLALKWALGWRVTLGFLFFSCPAAGLWWGRTRVGSWVLTALSESHGLEAPALSCESMDRCRHHTEGRRVPLEGGLPFHRLGVGSTGPRDGGGGCYLFSLRTQKGWCVYAFRKQREGQGMGVSGGMPVLWPNVILPRSLGASAHWALAVRDVAPDVPV